MKLVTAMFQNAVDDQPSGHFRRRFDVESTSKYSHVFQRFFDVEISTLIRRRIDVETSSSTSNWRRYFDGFLFGVENALKNRRRNFDVDSTSKFRLARWESPRNLGLLQIDYFQLSLNLLSIFFAELIIFKWCFSFFIPNEETKQNKTKKNPEKKPH